MCRSDCRHEFPASADDATANTIANNRTTAAPTSTGGAALTTLPPDGAVHFLPHNKKLVRFVGGSAVPILPVGFYQYTITTPADVVLSVITFC
jgi:hypothetical protein